MESQDECWRRVAAEFLGPEVSGRLVDLVQQQRTDPASLDFAARVQATDGMSDEEREELEALRALMFSSELGLRPLPACVLDRLCELEVLRHRERPGDE